MVETYKNKFNKKYGFPKDASHSLSEISKLTGYKLSGLRTIQDKGEGAFFFFTEFSKTTSEIGYAMGNSEGIFSCDGR